MPGPIISPPARLGVLGGGQLGGMFVAAARAMGYATAVLDPDPESPAGRIAHEHICASYEDPAALDALAGSCAAVTVEFENVPTTSLERVQGRVPVSPSPGALAVAQNRIREKRFMREAGVATVAFEAVREIGEIAAAFKRLSAACPAPQILKAARWGYDGKHQREVATPGEAAAAMAAFGGCECILEEKIELEREVSVVAVRGCDGETRCYPVAENEHRDGILHLSIVPARIDPAVGERVCAAAVAVVGAMNYYGVLGVEFFVARDGRLLVNEVAPRPHNSGHYTLDACAVSQFEQQARILCGLPAGDTRLLSPAVMVNLLGELWRDGEPPWQTLLRCPNLKLHVYGKAAARPGRKMGHFCVVGDDVERLREQAASLHAGLRSPMNTPETKHDAAA